MFIIIYLLSLAIGIAIMFFVVKEAVRKANEDLLQQTNALLQRILKQLGGNHEDLPPTRQMLLKELHNLIDQRRNGLISQEYFIEEQKRIENEKNDIKTN